MPRPLQSSAWLFHAGAFSQLLQVLLWPPKVLHHPRLYLFLSPKPFLPSPFSFSFPAQPCLQKHNPAEGLASMLSASQSLLMS